MTGGPAEQPSEAPAFAVMPDDWLSRVLNRTSCRVTPIPDEAEERLKAAAHKQFHAALADRLVGQWILKNEGLTEHFRSSLEGISQFGFRIMVRKDWEEFAEAFNQELAAIRENGELDAILSNYR